MSNGEWTRRYTSASPRPPAWRPGPMDPQHLQAADGYAEDRLNLLVAQLGPDAWGVSELRIDSGALAKGLFRIGRALGRFESGTGFDIRGIPAPFERPLPGSFGDRAEMTVFLGIAAQVPDAPNVTNDANTPFAFRYARASGTNPELAPIFRILFDDDVIPPAMECLPIARLRRRGLSIELDRRFTPPMLRMLAGTELATKLESLVAELKKRQTVLLSSRRGKAANLDPSRYAQLRLLSEINRALAGLSLTTVRGAPEPLYRKLSALLGAIEPLAGLSDDMPEMAHADPGPAFYDVVDRLLAIVPTVAPDPFVTIPLVRRDATTFEATAPTPESFRGRLLMVATGIDPRALVAQIPAFAKLSGPTHFGPVVQSSVPGIRVGVEFDPPGALGLGPADVCYRLEQRGEYWEDAVTSGRLFLFLNQAPQELSFTLYVVGRA